MEFIFQMEALAGVSVGRLRQRAEQCPKWLHLNNFCSLSFRLRASMVLRSSYSLMLGYSPAVDGYRDSSFYIICG